MKMSKIEFKDSILLGGQEWALIPDFVDNVSATEMVQAFKAMGIIQAAKPPCHLCKEDTYYGSWKTSCDHESLTRTWTCRQCSEFKLYSVSEFLSGFPDGGIVSQKRIGPDEPIISKADTAKYSDTIKKLNLKGKLCWVCTIGIFNGVTFVKINQNE